MIQNTLNKIEERLKKTETVTEENRSELLNLVSELKGEIEELSKTHTEHAESITGFAAISTREATRQEKNPALLQLSIDGLAASVEGFETSHPTLVGVVNRICSMLANLGI
ncbi:protein of unknown function [Syntrophus gentianae]|uniref:DUF4404 domain-containing protein n=1 Tax=Syntrophus gentianae TaxID=43775 RepID=A0A1H7UD81_9BACT|nr:DUF4404 family protein [Syntrophus gentianae]SEL94628.1 protein of unknown function [Syntrophus gentianae]